MSLHRNGFGLKHKEEIVREQKRKEILESLLRTDDQIKEIKDQNNIYSGLQDAEDQLENEAYILGKMYEKFGLGESIAKIAILKFGNYSKAMEFTDFYFKKMKGNIGNYSVAVEFAAKNGFSFTPKGISLLEQEVMNFQNKYNLDLTQTYHRDVPGSSSHYDEHNATRALDQQ